VISIVAAVFSWAALYIYKEYFFGMNWQLIYYGTTALNFILSLMQARHKIPRLRRSEWM
jgi:hypothetical protein